MTAIRVGDRVRLHAPSPTLTLGSDTGTVVRPADPYADLGYWVVRLDAPATISSHVGLTELSEVIEMDDNLTVLESAS